MFVLKCDYIIESVSKKLSLVLFIYSIQESSNAYVKLLCMVHKRYLGILIKKAEILSSVFTHITIRRSCNNYDP
jgi:hypothetical protein